MKKLLFTAALLLSVIVAHAQTCTLTADWTTNNPSCLEGGTADGKSVIVIPAGLTVNLDNGETWAGTTIEVYGVLNIVGNVTVNSSIVVGDGGRVQIPGKLALGTVSGCGYTLAVRTGGTVDTSNSASDRLTICGEEIIKGGGGGCNPDYPAGEPPYCDNGEGFQFTGPTGVDEDGYNGNLPIRLLYFHVGNEGSAADLSWATSMEENFYEFIVQRSSDGITFESIGAMKGQGFNIYDIESKYSFIDEAPLLGMNYYRLKAVDLDNSYEYSAVRAVKMNGPKKFAVYPNPSNGEAISFRVNFSPQENDRIFVNDQLGVEVFSAMATSNESTIIFENTLRPGVYMLRYVSQGFEQVSRVVVTH